MRDELLNSIENAIVAIASLKEPDALFFMEKTAEAIAKCYENGGKLLIAGNGGSLCDAMHFAEEMTGFFRQRRRALAAIALSDPGHITCTANDLAFEEVFARGVQAFGKPEDIFIGLTTSGNSPNIIRAFEEAKNQGLTTVAFLGKEGGKLKGAADFELVINGMATSDRIQEAHMAAIHMIIELVEIQLFSLAHVS